MRVAAGAEEEHAAESMDLRTAYHAYAGPMYWYALSLLGRADEAEDVVHDVFAALLRRGKGSVIAQPRAYLLKAVRRQSVRARRRWGREASLAEEEMVSWVEVIEDRDRALDVDRAVKSLPGEQREVVTLKVLGELTLREIGQVLGISENTVTSRYRLALVKLRVAPRKDGPDG